MAKIRSRTLVMGIGLMGLVASGFALGQEGGPQLKPLSDALVARILASPAAGDRLVGVALPDHTSGLQTTSCGSTINGSLTVHDFDPPAIWAGIPVPDGVWGDQHVLSGDAGETVTLDASSSDFVPALILFDSDDVTGEPFANDTGVANAIPGLSDPSASSARIVHTFGNTGLFTVAIGNFPEVAAGVDPGNYTLKITCTGGTDDGDDGGSGGGGNTPSAPSNLTATAVGTTDIELQWQDNSGNEDDFLLQIDDGGGFADLDTLAANSTLTVVTGLLPNTTYGFRLKARNSNGESGYSNEATATTFEQGALECTPGDSTHCLVNGRFKVEVAWRDFEDVTGSAQVKDVDVGGDSGLFFFFTENNLEMLIKVLNGCGINDRFWVFAAATTDVEYTVEVTDTDNGTVTQYFNGLGVASPAITDTEAFATCP